MSNWLCVSCLQTMKIFEEPREVDFFRANNVCRMELTASSPSNVVKSVENWLREKRGRSLVLASPEGELHEVRICSFWSFILIKGHLLDGYRCMEGLICKYGMYIL